MNTEALSIIADQHITDLRHHAEAVRRARRSRAIVPRRSLRRWVTFPRPRPAPCPTGR